MRVWLGLVIVLGGCGSVSDSDAIDGGSGMPDVAVPAIDGGPPDAGCGEDEACNVVVQASGSCAVRASGSVYCWGRNPTGGVGVAPATSSTCAFDVPCVTVPTKVEGLPPMASVNAFGTMHHVCGISRAGEVWCWGRNEFGQLGHANDGDASCAGTPCQWMPSKVADLADVVEVGVSRAFSCARTEGGGVYCWGRNLYGELGRGTLSAGDHRALAVVGLPGSVQHLAVSNDDSFACAQAGAEVYCWGMNRFGQHGHSPDEDPTCQSGELAVKCLSTPKKIAADEAGTAFDDVAALAVGDAVVCLLREAGTVWCAGHNGYAQVFWPPGSSAVQFRQVPGLPAIQSLSGRGQHVCGRTAGGATWCWGSNTWGEFGDGVIGAGDNGVECNNGLVCRPPSEVDLDEELEVLEAHQGAGWFLKGGQLWVWGRNTFGNLGHSPGTAGDVSCAPDDTCNPTPAQLLP